MTSFPSYRWKTNYADDDADEDEDDYDDDYSTKDFSSHTTLSKRAYDMAKQVSNFEAETYKNYRMYRQTISRLRDEVRVSFLALNCDITMTAAMTVRQSNVCPGFGAVLVCEPGCRLHYRKKNWRRRSKL